LGFAIGAGNEQETQGRRLAATEQSESFTEFREGACRGGSQAKGWTMTPVTIGSATLYLGDCREVCWPLPEVDVLVTDPPYGIGDRMQGGTWGAAEKYADFRKWDVAPQTPWLLSLASEIEAIVWGGNYFGLPGSRCWLSWDKQNAVPTMADFELAWTNLDRPAKRFSAPVGSHAHGHPTEKPLRLMEWCVSLTKGRRVLDPYMGSGTTGVACANLGRPFVGVEIDPRYFDVACKRIEAAQNQIRLFDDLERHVPGVKQADFGI
jgi:site-specific DNA-methyltransferase (adenine-specific)/modification methylase